MKILYFCIFILQAILISNGLSDKDCYLKNNNQSNATWKLDLQYNFDSKSDLENWAIWHETEKCHGNWVKQESCNTRDNVQVDSGFLVLQAKHEHYYEFNYTGGMITTKGQISYGRVEVKATQPVGDQFRTCIYTSGPTDMAWDAPGQIIMCTHRGEMLRSVRYANMGFANYFDLKDKFETLAPDMNHFHRYGWEWDREWIRFFFDDNYSETYRFNETHKLHPFHHLRIYIGVGYAYSGKPVPKNFTELNWKCPNYMIDYIRYYQKVDNVENLTECKNENNLVEENSKIENTCHKSMESMRFENEDEEILEKVPKEPIQTNFILIATIAIPFSILFIMAITYLVLQLLNARRKVHKQNCELAQIQAEQNIYCVIEDDGDGQYYEFEVDSKAKHEMEQVSFKKNNISKQSFLMKACLISLKKHKRSIQNSKK